MAKARKAPTKWITMDQQVALGHLWDDVVSLDRHACDLLRDLPASNTLPLTGAIVRALQNAMRQTSLARKALASQMARCRTPVG